MRTTAKLTGTVATFAALRLFSREAATRYVAGALAEMAGIGAKAAQLIGTRMGGAVAEPPPLDLSVVQSIIRTSAPELAGRIVSLDPCGRPASIGQAHAAILDDGRTVCIKVQRPGIADEVRAQLDVALRLGAARAPKRFGLDVSAYRAFLQAHFDAELDYRVEAATQRRLRLDLHACSGVVVPDIVLARRDLLVQGFEPSTPLDEAAKHADPSARGFAAQALARAFFHMLLLSGRLHADLHRGNLGMRLSAAPAMVLYDFGSTVEVPPAARKALASIVSGQAVQDDARARAALVAIGFDSAKTAAIGRPADALRAVVAPLRSDSATLPRTWSTTARLQEVLGGEAWWLRTAGPPWFLYVMRAWQGLTKAVDALGTPIHWRQAVEASLATSAAGALRATPASPVSIAATNAASPVSIAATNAAPPVSIAATNAAPPLAAGSPQASNLRVRITEGDEEIVALTMPVAAVEDLDSLLPDHAAVAVAAQGIDLVRIKQRALANGLQAQALFEATAGPRVYRVWLA